MEFHKLVHRAFLFGMFLVCCLAVISLAHSRVQASLSSATLSTTSPISTQNMQMESGSTITQNTISQLDIEIKTAETTIKEQPGIITETETKTQIADPVKTIESTTIKSDNVSTDTRTRTTSTVVKSSDSEKKLDDIETMEKLLLTDTIANSGSEIGSQADSDMIDSSSEVKEVTKSAELVEKAVENADDRKILTGQVFTQPTVMLVEDLKKEKNPKLSGDVNANLSIGNVELIKKYDGQKSLLFSGKVEPNALFNIFIFSKDPVVMTIKADENGDWSYEMTKELADGQHEVYIAVTERDGRIVKKSQPFAFVKTAEAATSIPVSELDEYKSPMQRSTASYITIAIAIISVCLAIALALIGILNHKHKTDETII